ncbi:hypothetical protein ACFLS8_05480 [Chloroflexota bacterium]
METDSEWLKGIKKELALLKDTLDEKSYKKYRVSLLACLAERTAQFFPTCGQCQILQQDISGLVQEVSNLAQLGNRERQKSYSRSIDRIASHLKKQHKLVDEWYYMGIAIAIGSGLGVAISAAFGEFGSGVAVGAGVGTAAGAYLDNKAKKGGRVLCPKESRAATGKSFKYSSVIIGVGILVLLAGLAIYFFVSR